MAVTEKCYCAFCKHPRSFYSKKHVRWTDVVSSFVLAMSLMFISWQGFDPRMLLFFALFLGLFEVAIHFRWRITISCRICGFDPVLYQKSPTMAADQVKAFLDRRRGDPNYILSRHPLAHLSSRKITEDQPAKETTRGEHFSTHV